jgi:hypothetical protein
MAGKDAVLTLARCLEAALVAAVERGTGAELYEARFGRFSAEGAGWYWNLTFRADVGSHPTIGLQGDKDPLVRRFSMIIAAYEEERARGTGGDK